MTGRLASEIHNSLAASRDEADRILERAEVSARGLSAMAAETDRALADARIARLAGLRAEIAQHHERIELAYAAMIEAMARTTVGLAEAARDADFSLPPWPEGIRTVLELKLVETRELTIRLARETIAAGPPMGGPRIPPDITIEGQERG